MRSSFSGKPLPRPSGPYSSLETPDCSRQQPISRCFLGQLSRTPNVFHGPCKCSTHFFLALGATSLRIISVQILHFWTEKESWRGWRTPKRTESSGKSFTWTLFPACSLASVFNFPTTQCHREELALGTQSQRPPVMATTGAQIFLALPPKLYLVDGNFAKLLP